MLKKYTRAPNPRIIRFLSKITNECGRMNTTYAEGFNLLAPKFGI